MMLPACMISIYQPQPRMESEPSCPQPHHAPVAVCRLAADQSHHAGGRGVDRGTTARSEVHAIVGGPLGCPEAGDDQRRRLARSSRTRRSRRAAHSAATSTQPTARAAPLVRELTTCVASGSCFAYASGYALRCTPARRRSAPWSAQPGTLEQVLVELPRCVDRIHDLVRRAPALAGTLLEQAERVMVVSRAQIPEIVQVRLLQRGAIAITQPRGGTCICWPTLTMLAAL